MSEAEVRWAGPEDGRGVARVLESNSLPGETAFEDRFLVAKEGGGLLAVLQYRVPGKRLVLGRLAVDPRVGERDIVVALYSGAGDLARRAGLEEVWADAEGYGECLLQAGYRRRMGGWRLDPARPFDNYKDLPESGWRRVLSLWGATNAPFFRAFG